MITIENKRLQIKMLCLLFVDQSRITRLSYILNGPAGILDEFYSKTTKATELTEELGIGGWMQLRESTINIFEKRWQEALKNG